MIPILTKNEDGVTVLSAGGYLNDVDLAVIYEESKNNAFSDTRRVEIFFAIAFLFISLMVWVLRQANAKTEKARKELEGLFAEQKNSI